MREDGTVNFLLTDHLGSTNVTTDSSGVLVSSMLYTAFGETRSSNGMTASDYLYTGQREESEIGLYFYKARWYDPALARFISADTLVPQPGDPLAWDRYAYVRNNPINGIDPTGHAFCMDGDQFCYDSNNQQWLGNLPSQLTFTFYTSHPTPYTDHNAVFEQSVAQLSQVGIFMGRVLVEPVDWGFVAYDCLQGTCNLWDFAGLLPLLPAGLTKYGDDAVLAMLHLDDIVVPTGQYHHVLSNKIMNALEEHKNLSGIFNRDDFIVQALDTASHRGYQEWHRIYDDEIVPWIARYPKATSQQFLQHLHNVY